MIAATWRINTPFIIICIFPLIMENENLNNIFFSITMRPSGRINMNSAKNFKMDIEIITIKSLITGCNSNKDR